MSWRISLAPEQAGSQPLFARIVAAISGDIERGRLRSGDRLPGSRELARELGVHRNTVLAAYDELRAQGWIRTEAARGTFVNDELGASPLQRPPKGMAARPAFELEGSTLVGAPPAASEARVLNLAGGLPDPRLVPTTEIARAMGRVLRRRGPELLSYGDGRGRYELREQIAEMLAHSRGIAARPENLLITRGSQMGLYLAAQTLIREGSRVAVEEYGYQPAWAALRRAGAELCPVGIDDEGLRIDELERHARAGRLSAVYVTPHHQFPTLVTMSAPRRQALLELARTHRLAIIEDDYDHEFHYRGRPVLPLASIDRHGSVLHVGTLSKILAPGLRIGYVVAPEPVIDCLLAQRHVVDRQGDQIGEAALAEMLEDDLVQRHARRARRIYLARRELMVRELRRHFADEMSFDEPDGGLALWVRMRRSRGLRSWSRRCLARGVRFSLGADYHMSDRPQPFVRIGFAACNETELRRALRVMAEEYEC